ncbi:unnamed protein product [Pleuronectes platessa]|uniref:Immunoglobulin domain-containing protein n=1 Tax=Pleuronectes platessa TaxID=8262 RepID=A0A9N7URL0_PLEPL|nr:unnamed protein product [Pleuronectes platessa]
MLLLPAAALCCLCSALVATAAELTQDQLSLTATIGGEASFSCGGTDQHNYIWWFQKKDTGTFTLILDISRDGSIDKGYNHPQKDDFTAERQQNSWELKIKKVKPSHAATYYCAVGTLEPTVIHDVCSLNKNQYEEQWEREVNHSVTCLPSTRQLLSTFCSRDSYVQPRLHRFAVVPQTNLSPSPPFKDQSEQVSRLQLVLCDWTAGGIGPVTEL